MVRPAIVHIATTFFVLSLFLSAKMSSGATGLLMPSYSRCDDSDSSEDFRAMLMNSPQKRALGVLLGVVVLIAPLGCSSLDLFSQRFQSPDDMNNVENSQQLVGDLAVPYGMFPVEVDGIGLVTRLQDTGSDPPPSSYRNALLGDMKARGVEHPSRVLASKGTAMVLVHGILPPGIKAGDPFDLQVRVLDQSGTTSLRGGFLLETRLKEMRVLGDQQVHEGRPWGVAKGAILVDPSADTTKNHVLACRGRILGGGHALRTRSLGLVLQEGYQNVYYSARIANAINKRFYENSPGGIQEGMAKAHTNQYIELKVHDRYRDNIPRYMQIVRAIALQERPAERLERLELLEKQLLDPITSNRAASQLEAIGKQGIDTLKKGLKSNDTEVRFRSAEALAYLDQSEAALILAQVSRDEPAFRVFALTALATMNDPIAYEQLCSLLEVPSAETRYGAFRALWTMNPLDRRVMGERLAGDFSYHVLPTKGKPMIHVTRNQRAEIVLFGDDQRFVTPLILEAGKNIRIKSDGKDRITISRFAVGEPDQKRTVSTRVDDVIRAIAELGGNYPDVVQVLQQAKTKGVLPSRFEVDALPEAGRRYERMAHNADAGPTVNDKRSPFAMLWKPGGETPSEGGVFGGLSSENGSHSSDSDTSPHPMRHFFAKMMGQDTD